MPCPPFDDSLGINFSCICCFKISAKTFVNFTLGFDLIMSLILEIHYILQVTDVFVINDFKLLSYILLGVVGIKKLKIFLFKFLFI